MQAQPRRQKATLDAYDISLSSTRGRGIGPCGRRAPADQRAVHRALHETAGCSMRSTLQFYDAEAEHVPERPPGAGPLPRAGLQVRARLRRRVRPGAQLRARGPHRPGVHAHGHRPRDAPGGELVLRPARPSRTSCAATWRELEADHEVRAIVPQAIEEFLAPPVIYVKNERAKQYEAMAAKLPRTRVPRGREGQAELRDRVRHHRRPRRRARRAGGGGPALPHRQGARAVPHHGQHRVGRAAPVIDGVEGLTVWCWPESLWAPISFTMAVNDELGLPRGSWRDFWCSHDAQVYQFIGQDNLYFYGVAQPALWEALRPGDLVAGRATDAPAAPDAPRRQPPHPVRQQEGLLVGRGQAAHGRRASGPLHGRAAPRALPGAGPGSEIRRLQAQAVPRHRGGEGRSRASPIRCSRRARCSRTCSTAWPAAASTRRRRTSTAACRSAARRRNASTRCTTSCAPTTSRCTASSCTPSCPRWTSSSVGPTSAGPTASARPTRHRGRRDAPPGAARLVLPAARGDACSCIPWCRRAARRSATTWTSRLEDLFSWNYDFEDMDELCSAGEITAGAHPVRELPPRFDFFKKHPTQYK